MNELKTYFFVWGKIGKNQIEGYKLSIIVTNI